MISESEMWVQSCSDIGVYIHLRVFLALVHLIQSITLNRDKDLIFLSLAGSSQLSQTTCVITIIKNAMCSACYKIKDLQF